MKRGKVAAIIQARMGSTRLPGKVMKPLRGHPVLWHVIQRTSRAELIDQTIVATTSRSEDDVIHEFCVANHTDVFRGSEQDVLDRFYQCAKQYDIHHIVRITADCPLHDPHVIDTVVTQYLEGDYKFVTNTVVYTFPDGLDVEVFPFEVLESAWKGATSKSEREHVTSYIRNHTRLRTRNVYSGVQYPPYRLTLDYPEDYQLIVAIYEGIDRELFHLDEVVRFLGEHGELARINEHIERKIAHHALPGDPTSYVKDKDTL